MIKVTSAHLIMWTNRNKPSWAKNVEMAAKAGIDGIINERAYGREKNFDCQNAISLLQLVQSNHNRASNYGKKDHPDMVQYMIDFPKNSSSERGRGKWYVRWTKKIKAKRLVTTL
jgi:hypothetical protein